MLFKNNYILLVLMIISIILQKSYGEKYLTAVGDPNMPSWKYSQLGVEFMGAPNTLYWVNNNVTWYLHSNGAFPDASEADTKISVSAAYNSWEQVSTSTVNFTDGGIINREWENDGTNLHYWPPLTNDAYDSGGPLYSSDIYAINILTYNENNELIDADILYNKNKYWRNNGRNSPDIQATATHEIGHSIGLAHTEVSTSPSPTMKAGVGSTAPSASSLEFDDLTGVSFLYGGNLIDNESLNGTFLWDIRNISGKTITINAGSELSFKNGSSLEINGTLNINGAAGNMAILDFESLSSSNGLKLYDNSTASISRAELKNGRYGIYLYNTNSVTIDNSNIHNNSYGLYLNSSEPSLNSNIIANNSYGIRIYNSYATPDWNTEHIYNNSIISNTAYGLYLYNSSPTISNNIISGNKRSSLWSASNPIFDENYIIGSTSTSYALACFGDCSPSMYKNGSTGGYNVITGNAGNGIRITANSDPIIGKLSSGAGGYNSIYNNGGYEIDNVTGSSIQALHNWWGSTSGPGLGDITGTVLWNPALNYDPNPQTLLKQDDMTLFGKSGNNTFFPNIDSDLPVNLQRAYYEQSKRNYTVAADSFMNHFVLNKEDIHNTRAVIQYIKSLSFIKTTNVVINEVITVLRNDLDNSTKYALFIGLTNLYLHSEDPEHALASLDKAIKFALTKEEINYIFIQKAMIYAYTLNDKESAEKYIILVLDSSTKGTEYYVLANEERGNILGEQFNYSVIKTDSNHETPISAFRILSNYPNPFNASTTIRFEIAEKSNIEFSIYDLRGSLVFKDYLQNIGPGIHNIFWSGINNKNEAIASGVYFYKIKAIYLDTKKTYTSFSRMILLK